MFGRLMFGVFVGIQNFCFNKALNDYVPAEILSYHSIQLNGGFMFGIFTSNLAGSLLIPLDDPTKMKKDENWRLIFCVFPAIMQVYAIFMLTFFFRNLSIIDLLAEAKENKE